MRVFCFLFLFANYVCLSIFPEWTLRTKFTFLYVKTARVCIVSSENEIIFIPCLSLLWMTREMNEESGIDGCKTTRKKMWRKSRIHLHQSIFKSRHPYHFQYKSLKERKECARQRRENWERKKSREYHHSIFTIYDVKSIEIELPRTHKSPICETG